MRIKYLKILVLLFVVSFVGCSDSGEEFNLHKTLSESNDLSNKALDPNHIYIVGEVMIAYDVFLNLEEITVIREDYYDRYPEYHFHLVNQIISGGDEGEIVTVSEIWGYYVLKRYGKPAGGEIGDEIDEDPDLYFMF